MMQCPTGMKRKRMRDHEDGVLANFVLRREHGDYFLRIDVPAHGVWIEQECRNTCKMRYDINADELPYQTAVKALLALLPAGTRTWNPDAPTEN